MPIFWLVNKTCWKNNSLKHNYKLLHPIGQMPPCQAQGEGSSTREANRSGQ